jgi:hypothetical protein
VTLVFFSITLFASCEKDNARPIGEQEQEQTDNIRDLAMGTYKPCDEKFSILWETHFLSILIVILLSLTHFRY